MRQQKEIKGIQIRKEDVKLSLFADDMRVYISDSKNSTKEFLQLMINNVGEYKINSKISVALLYTNDKWMRKQSEKHNPYNRHKKHKISRSNYN